MTTDARHIAGLLLCGLITLFSTGLSASDRYTGAWSTVYASGGLHRGEEGGPWRYGLYGDFRHYDRLKGIDQYVLQPAVGYRLNSRVSFWGGYTYFHSSVHAGPTTSEHRVWEQLSWNVVHWYNATLNSRTRLEQRSRDGREGTDLRLRQQIRFESRFSFNHDLKFILGDEFFYHLNDTNWTLGGYSQNRFYTGLGWDYHSHTFEVLYLNQQYRVRQAPDIVNHVLVLGFRL